MEYPTPILLRGHHIGIFGCHYWRDHHFLAPLNFPESLVEIYMRVKLKEKENPYWISSPTTTKSDLIKKSGLLFRDKSQVNNYSNQIFRLLEVESNLDVKVVEGFDSICSKCPDKNESCLKNIEDAFCVEAYNLKIGTTYSAKELLQTVRDFGLRFSLVSPRPLFWFIDLARKQELE
jgi:hypothetical protein